MAYCRLAKNNFKKLLTMVDASYIIISVGWLVGINQKGNDIYGLSQDKGIFRHVELVK